MSAISFLNLPFTVSEATFHKIEEASRITGLFLTAFTVAATSVVGYSKANDYMGDAAYFLIAPEIILTKSILETILPTCGNVARSLARRCMQIKDA